MWTYKQTSGQLLHDGELISEGYSGAGIGRNNPEMQHVRNVGPIPQGRYGIGVPYDTTTHGPFVMHLIPSPENEMFGRSGFLIHGDNEKHAASEGCIIMNCVTRNLIAQSLDGELEVTV